MKEQSATATLLDLRGPQGSCLDAIISGEMTENSAPDM